MIRPSIKVTLQFYTSGSVYFKWVVLLNFRKQLYNIFCGCHFWLYDTSCVLQASNEAALHDAAGVSCTYFLTFNFFSPVTQIDGGRATLNLWSAPRKIVVESCMGATTATISRDCFGNHLIFLCTAAIHNVT